MSAKHILIVDDNEKNLKLIRDVLQFKGFTTLEAADGENAVRLATETVPALILMDVQLPGMSGCEAMKAIKADDRTRAIPIIALTAMAMRGTRESLLSDGFDDYISKPVEIKAVLNLVQKYLSPSPPSPPPTRRAIGEGGGLEEGEGHKTPG
jgi:two-component system, cell cycle response regulator DivK